MVQRFEPARGVARGLARHADLGPGRGEQALALDALRGIQRRGIERRERAGGRARDRLGLVASAGEAVDRRAAPGDRGVEQARACVGPVTMQECLHGLKIVLGANASFTWASEEFLLEHQVTPFQELPFWLPASAQHHYANDRAIAAGMTFRPLGETALDTLRWHHEERDASYQWRGYGMQPERERDLLAKWHARASGAADAGGEGESEG